MALRSHNSSTLYASSFVQDTEQLRGHTYIQTYRYKDITLSYKTVKNKEKVQKYNTVSNINNTNNIPQIE